MIPSLFLSFRTKAAEYSEEPRTKSASLGERSLPLTQGSDKTLSHSSELYTCVYTPIISQFVGIAVGMESHGRCLVLVSCTPEASSTLELGLRAWLCMFPGVIRTRRSKATIQDPVHDRCTKCWSLHNAHLFLVHGRTSSLVASVHLSSKITLYPRCRRRRSVSWLLRPPAMISISLWGAQAVSNPLVPDNTSFPSPCSSIV